LRVYHSTLRTWLSEIVGYGSLMKWVLFVVSVAIIVIMAETGRAYSDYPYLIVAFGVHEKK
jgi:hypothetical protein